MNTLTSARDRVRGFEAGGLRFNTVEKNRAGCRKLVLGSRLVFTDGESWRLLLLPESRGKSRIHVSEARLWIYDFSPRSMLGKPNSGHGCIAAANSP
jgi:hypothetical protein